MTTVIVGKISCGFGNQLFQYACAYAVSREQGVPLIIDCLTYDKKYDRRLEIDKLSISAKLVKSNFPKYIRGLGRLCLLIGHKYYKETTPHQYDSKVFSIGKRAYLSGYWQSEKYFRKYKEELQKEFSPKFATNKIKLYSEKYRNAETCAVHIRRGDYVQLKDCIDMNYYVQAMGIIRLQKENCRFIFFSDDIEWVKKYFSSCENVDFFDHKDDICDLEEFFIMSSCRNQIIANSTFSWWAAYLNPYMHKTIIAPEGEKWGMDFYPDEWIKLKVQ